jgi:hypothetical protein
MAYGKIYKDGYLHTPMKVHMNICVDADVAVKLRQEKNISALINSYLRHFFEIPSETSKVKLEIEKKAAEEIAAIIGEKIEVIEKKEEADAEVEVYNGQEWRPVK